MTSGSAPFKDLRGWLAIMASPAILFYALPWLIVLLVAGTVAQKDLGLYAAQEVFFSSWLIWLGPFPLPGAYPTLGVITLCLLAKFLLYSPWRAHQSGIILSHLGVLVLMLGGMITAFSQQESYISLREGQSGSASFNYHDRVLRIEKDGKLLADVPFESLAKGERIDLPFEATIEDICRNCRPMMARNPENRRGFAGNVELMNAAPEKEDEANLSGITISFSGLGEDQDGIYVTMEEIPHSPQVTFGGSEYSFSASRAQTALPFSIELKKFTRDLHPGTDMASGFSSDIVVKDGNVEWPYTVRMNEPLRYKGYTFYQSSFAIKPDGQYSILSVVQNKGRIFPYLASVIIFAGLLLHIVLRLRTRKKAQ